MTLAKIIESATQSGKRGKRGKHGVLLLATANPEGIPHVATVNMISNPAASQVAITGWFCPVTVANCVPGRAVSLVIWDSEENSGHHLTGQVTRVEEVAMMDGYLPEAEPLPQVERRLFVEVDGILALSCRAHSDAGD